MFATLIVALMLSAPARAFDTDPAGTSSPSPVSHGSFPVELIIDDGTSENSIGDDGQFIWLNRFTPDPTEFPLQIHQIEVEFGTTMVSAGDEIELLVYSDTDGDGDPGTGSVLLAQITETVQSPGGLNTYSLTSPVQVDGPGDVLVGVVNRYSSEGFSDFPAALDQTASAGRSWVGSWAAGDAPVTPNLPADEQWGTIDSFSFPGNWVIRASGATITGDDFSQSVPTLGQWALVVLALALAGLGLWRVRRSATSARH